MVIVVLLCSVVAAVSYCCYGCCCYCACICGYCYYLPRVAVVTVLAAVVGAVVAVGACSNLCKSLTGFS